MPMARPWPTHADNLRMDYIALALDIQQLCRELYQALMRGDELEAARLNAAIFAKAHKQQALMLTRRNDNGDSME